MKRPEERGAARSGAPFWARLTKPLVALFVAAGLVGLSTLSRDGAAAGADLISSGAPVSSASAPGSALPVASGSSSWVSPHGSVPRTAPVVSSSGSSVEGMREPLVVDLNAASIDDLRRLPGIGPKRAAAILELRGKLGRFRRVEELLRVRGFGRKSLARLRPHLTVGLGAPTP